MISGAVLGYALGAWLSGHWEQLTPRMGEKVRRDALAGGFKLCGDLFLNLLNLLVVPLVVLSVTHAVGALSDIRRLGRVFLVILIYFLCSMFMACGLGLALVNTIRPGESVALVKTADAPPPKVIDVAASPSGKIYDSIRDMVPSNLLKAAVEKNVLGLIFFSIAFGAILSGLGARGRSLVDGIGMLNEAFMRLVQAAIWLAPLGILGLVAETVGSAGGAEAIGEMLRKLFWYALTVVLGLLLHGCVTLPLLLYVFGKRNPLKYAANMSEALVTAFTTASSSATLPVTFRCLEERNGIRPQTTRLVASLGATANMNGTALYEAVAALYIAQVHGIPLDFGQQVIVLLTATLAAIGAAAIPGAGLVTMAMVLVAVDLPLEGIAMILSIDWILDRCRTCVNVWDDGVGCAIIDPWMPSETPPVTKLEST